MLIEDVVMPHAEQYTDPERPLVRRRSIGNLHRQYLRRRPKRPAGTNGSLPVRNVTQRRFSVVPPLQTLPAASDSMPGFPVAALLLLSAPIEAARFLVRKLVQIKDKTAAAGAGFYAALTGRSSRRYSAASGVSPSWRTIVWDARYAVPIVLIVFILSLLLLGLLRGPQQNGQAANKAGTSMIPVTSVLTVGGKGGSGGTKGGSGSNFQGSAASASGSGSSATGSGSSALHSGGGLSSPTSSTAPSGGSVTPGMGGGPTGGGGGTGGSGGGGSTLPTCTLGQIATTTCTVTQCTPTVTLQPGQKAILGVSGTCVVIN